MKYFQFDKLSRSPARASCSLVSSIVFIIAILALFYSPITYAQESCGDFIYLDPSDEDYVEPVNDCDNPFGVVDGERFGNVVIQIDGQELSGGDALTYEQLPVSLEPTVSFDGDAVFTDSGFELFYHSDGNYVSDYTLNVSATGTYTLVHTISEQPQQVFAPLDWLQNLFIKTAHAQFDFGPLERTAITFSVALTEAEPESTGASSVLFLPGIQASRLYKERIIGTEDRIWESQSNIDATDLEFAHGGISIEEVYTKDVIDEFTVLGFVRTVDIYKNLLDTFSNLENDKTIGEFLPFAYDWRYDVFHVATQDVVYPNEEVKRLKEEIERIAVDSHSEKVTVVAHSNGGLVLKALFASYPEQNFIEKIDKVIMIGTPQIGAPKAIASLLHGYDQGIPLTISDSIARSLALNFPGAYGLLPSDEYLTSGAAPTVFFDSSVSTSQFRTQYGNAINDSAELESFLLGQEGRDDADTIEAAAIINETLLQNAGEQADILNSLSIPAEIEFYTIVGTGKETEVAFEYREFTERICTQELFTEVCETEVFYKPVPILSLDGDGTVPAVSAAYDGIVHYFDLRDTPYEHKDLTEYNEILEFIESVVLDKEVTVNSTGPVYTSDQLLIGIHSPMEILITDAEDNQSGIIGENILTDIPNSSYRELAGSKYVTVPADAEITIVFTGQAIGGATVTIDEFSNNGQVKKAMIPITVVSPTTRSTMSISSNGVSNLETDIDGNGIIDEIRTPDGELVIIDDPQFTYSDLLTSIAKVENRFAKRFLTRVAERAEKFGQRSQVSPRFEKIERQLLRLLEKSTKRLEHRGIIESDLAEEVLVIINVIKNNK